MICNRCEKPIGTQDEMVVDFLKSKYPDKNICENCDLLLTLASSATEKDLINNQPPGTTLKLMLDNYN